MHEPPYTLKEIKVELTHACLLNCVHCSSLAGKLRKQQMTLSQCKQILLESSLMGVREVVFSGGEPLLWVKLPEAIGYASNAGMNVSLYSTGVAPIDLSYFDSLKKAGLSRVMFSIYSKLTDVHESITLVKGSLHKTLAAVQKCVKNGLHVEFHFVPMSINYKELRAVIELAHELGVTRVSVLRLVPQGRASNHETLKLKKEENLALRQSLIELIDEGHDVRVGSPFNILMLRKNPECCAGIDRLTISPNLSIVPCDAFKQISPAMINISGDYSSLAYNSLSDCWTKSLYLEKIREYLTTPFATECIGCSMLNQCLSGCVAQKFYVYGNLVKRRDPMCLTAKM
jgi:radical SAM protein with 4Fe4S-binding SPASM domain